MTGQPFPTVATSNPSARTVADRVRQVAAPAARVVPTALLVAMTLALTWREHGSIRATDWLPYALAALLLLAAVLAAGVALQPSRTVAVAVAALGALALLAGLSFLWSPLPSLARDEGLLVLFYVTVFLLPLLTLETARDRLAATALIVAGAGGSALAVALVLVADPGRTDLFTDGRLGYPLGYSNATGAAAAFAVFPALALAARRSWNPLARAGSLAAACACVGVVLMTQSKGAVLGLLVGTTALLALAPLRLRLLVPLAATALLAAFAYLRLTGPFRVSSEAETSAATHDAGVALLALAAAGAVAGALYALVDRRLSLSPRTVRRAGVAVSGLFAVAVVAGAIAFVASVGSPASFAQDKFETFKRSPRVETGSSHLVNLGSNRWDAWTVAWSEFRHHPVAGIGARGFRASYEMHKKSAENLARAHSLEMDVLSETGLLGFTALALALGIPLVLAGRRALRAAGAAALVAAAAGWLAHASVDWIWTFPVVGVPFFAVLGIAASSAGRPRLPTRGARVGAAAAVVVGLVLLVPPWLSGRLTDRVIAGRSADVAADADRAHLLDPLNTTAVVLQARVATTQEEAFARLRQAVDMAPRDYALRFALGSAYEQAGRIREARLELLTARALAPHDPFVLAAIERVGEQG